MEDNILSCFELIELTAEDYITVLRSCTSRGMTGGMVYDALHLCAAQKGGCDLLYTFNVKDFRSLAPAELADKIAAP